MGDCPVTWSATIYCIGPRSQVYDSYLEEFPTSHGDTIDDGHYFSPTDGWPVKEDYPDFRGHATGMRPRSQGWMGRAFTLSGIRLQQQLSSENIDSTL